MTTCDRPRATLIAALALGFSALAGPSGAGASGWGRPAGPASPGSVLPPATSGDSVQVSMQNVRFSPPEVTVGVGDTVTWTHRDSQLSHHVGAHDGSFDSHPTCGRPFGVCMKGGGTFSFTFMQAGTYEYHCRPHASSHAGMVGTITVVE